MRKIKTETPKHPLIQFHNERSYTMTTEINQGLHHELAQKLKLKLLNIGGFSAMVNANDPDLPKMVQHGRRFPAKSITMRGEPCRCHSNVAFLWEANMKKVNICTGYALSKDGIWRCHSWGWHGSRTIETTVKRVAYYGFILTNEEASEFFEQNCI